MNFQHILNEVLIGIAFSISYIFTYDLPTESQDFFCKHTFTSYIPYIAYMILAIVAFIITFNIMIVMIDFFKSLKLLI